VNSVQLLPAIRDLYSRLPETYVFEPWELVHVLYYHAAPRCVEGSGPPETGADIEGCT
jgi:hypothetical protein